MLIGVLKEAGNENRVAILPPEVNSLKKMGIDVVVENNAGKEHSHQTQITRPPEPDWLPEEM